jgi:hypothetical protein
MKIPLVVRTLFYRLFIRHYDEESVTKSVPGICLSKVRSVETCSIRSGAYPKSGVQHWTPQWKAPALPANIRLGWK